MKKYILLITLIFVQTKVIAQTQTEFENFLHIFKLCNYPHVASEDYEKMTKINISPNTIDEKLLQTFVYDQGIKPVALNCNQEDFLTYESYIQFPPTDSAYLITLVPEMRSPMCRSGLLLVTFAKNNYKLQDTLWISFEGRLEPQYIDGQRIGCTLDIESKLIEDSIYVTRTESHFFRLNNVPKGQVRSKKIKETIYNTTYKMTVGGKFVIINDKKTDKIIDTLAEKLKETPRIVR
jgi:hypothetical protein